MTREKPYSAANLQNSIEENCGPFSDITVGGIPCLAKIDLCDKSLLLKIRWTVVLS